MKIILKINTRDADEVREGISVLNALLQEQQEDLTEWVAPEPPLEDKKDAVFDAGYLPGARLESSIKEPAHLVDSRGVEWDAEKHTRTRSKNKDGSWKIKRNLAEDENAPSEKAFLPDPKEAFKNPALSALTSSLPEPQFHGVAQGGEEDVTYDQVLFLIGTLFTQGILSRKDILGLIAGYGLDGLASLKDHPGLLKDAMQKLKAYQKSDGG